MKLLDNESKLKLFILFTFLFFLAEIVSGYYTGSVALIADSFRMLSDVVVFVVALYASKVPLFRGFYLIFP